MMSNENTYSFKVHNNKAGLYLLLCLAGIPAIFLLVTLDIVNIWLMLLLIFAPVIWGFILVNKNLKISEEITLYENYLVSRIYEKVDFDEIDAAGSMNIKTASLKLILKSGKKISWSAYTTYNENEDVKELKRFIDDLSKAVQYLSESTSNPVEKANSATEKGAEAVLAGNPAETTGNNFQDLNQDLNKVKNKKYKASHIAIPASLVLALIVLVKMCGTSFSHHRDEESLRPVREAISQHLTEGRSLKDSAQEIINQYAASHGPYYLLSNDTAARLTYLPKPELAPALPIPKGQSRIKPVFDDGGKTDYYKKIVHYPDSMSWCVCLQTARKPYLLTKHWFDSDDDIRTYLYVSMINLSKYITVPSSSSYDGAGKKDSARLEIAKAIPMDSTLSLAENIKRGLLIFRALIKKYPDSSKFYLAARTGEGRMNKDLFEKASSVFKKQLAKMKVDTAKFEMKDFDTNN